jgi:hypothetical protein
MPADDGGTAAEPVTVLGRTGHPGRALAEDLDPGAGKTRRTAPEDGEGAGVGPAGEVLARDTGDDIGVTVPR